MEAILRQPAGIPVGGQFAPTAHAEPDVTLTAEPELTTLGEYQVPAPALRAAREVWAAVENEPGWRRHEAAEAWAKERGYEADTWDNYREAGQAHGHGVVLVSELGAAVTLRGQGRRNFSVDLDTLDTGDDDGAISPVTFIYV
ncbi:MAG TPA: hypothetical protein DEP82_06350 [Arthrobacter bacterium]|jgi:hypothetical protein|nr:hypothetical protein [Arthrobacter sp.]HCB57548.1 hypothetical protein [Arthrobacter sp.]HCC41063.1 hypothetical protein [Arthrobacter sp.]